MARTIRSWIEELEADGRQAFLAGHPEPFLVVLSTRAPAPPAEGMSFQTIRLGPASQLSLDTRDLEAHPIVKQTSSNAFVMMITVGRAANNDVVLDVANVSKFHGFFVQREGRWHLQDANSSNGTSVEGTPLEANRPCPLEDDCRVQFATVKCRFLTVARFVDLLEGEAQR